MIVRQRDLSKNLNSNICYYLLYGPNSGLIEETVNEVLKPNFTKNIMIYNESEIIINIDAIEENILNNLFFYNKKLIFINLT